MAWTSRTLRPRTSILLLIAAILILTGITAILFAPHLRECAIANEIEQLDGKVEWTLIRPNWIPAVVSDDWLWGFDRVTTVDLGGTKASDRDLIQLKQLPHVQVVYLDNSNVTDDGLKHMRGLPNVKYLCLGGTRITDSAMQFLGQMSNLRFLALNDTKITDDGVEHLKKSADLFFLSLENTRVSNSTLEWVDRHINSRLYADKLPD